MHQHGEKKIENVCTKRRITLAQHYVTVSLLKDCLDTTDDALEALPD